MKKMTMRWLWAIPSLLVLMVAGIVLAQEVLIQGVDSNNNVRNIRTNSLGILESALTATHGACTYTSLTVGTTATNCPVNPRVGRSSITIQMRTAGAILNVRNDGNPATSSTGFSIQNFDLYTDNLVDTVNMSCICSTGGCDVRISECE